jgi:hypothetical protein
MLGLVARVLFATTAVAPVGIIYAYALHLDGKEHLAALVVATSLSLVAFAAYFLRWCINNLQASSVNLTSVEIADQENIAFLLLYISPLFTDSVSSLNLSIAIPVVLLFIMVIVSGNSYHFNPLLNLAGWHFYKVSTPDSVGRVLITRRSIRNVLGSCQIVQLTDYVVLEV